MGDFIKIKSTADDGFEFDAYHAEAQGKRRGGVVVIQEIFGIDQYVKADVERWAALGFEAIAPSMYDRVQRGFHAEHNEAGIAEAFKTVRAANPTDALADMQAVINHLKTKGPVFITGYCYGGTMVWQAVGKLQGLSAGASWYGGGVAGMADLAPQAPVISHLGRKDANIPADDVKAKIQGANPGVPVYIYENSGHGFNNDGRPDSDPDDAALARKRTLELFEANGAL
ncbi:MAG: dienelactone hydrolase family protein [Caulobacteraceae bacterium]